MTGSRFIPGKAFLGWAAPVAARIVGTISMLLTSAGLSAGFIFFGHEKMIG